MGGAVLLLAVSRNGLFCLLGGGEALMCASGHCEYKSPIGQAGEWFRSAQRKDIAHTFDLSW